MTFDTFVFGGRRQIKDKVVPYRWSDAVWRHYTDKGLQWLWGIHPEAFCGDSIVVDPPTALTNDGTKELPIVDSFAEALTDYVCSLVIGEDREEAANDAVSNAHFERARSEV